MCFSRRVALLCHCLPCSALTLPGCCCQGEGSEGRHGSCCSVCGCSSPQFLPPVLLKPLGIQGCDGFPERVHEEALTAGCVSLCPDSEAGPASLRRGSAQEEAARLVPAAGRREGTVGEEPGT